MTAPFRIAHLLPWGNIGGTEIATMRAARAAIAFGASCRLFLPVGAVELEARARAEGLETEFYDWAEPSLRHGLAYWKSNQRLAGALRAWGANLLHTSEVLAAFRLSLAGRMAGIPVLCHVRNRQTFFSRRDQLFLRPITRYAFVSASTQKTFGVPIPLSAGTVLYDALDAPAVPTPRERVAIRSEVAAEFGFPAAVPLVGMVGRVDPQKDFSTFLQAVRIVLREHPETRFLAIGALNATPDAALYYEREVQPLLAADAVLRDRVIFTGFRSDAGRLMTALDIFALATHFEGFPLVILEAMARGIPVCATAVDGVPEAIAEGSGLVHPPADAPALAADLSALLGDSARAEAIGAAGRRRVETVFSPHRYASELEALYRSLLAGRTAVT